MKSSEKRLKNTTGENSQKGVTEKWQPMRCLTPFIEKLSKEETMKKDGGQIRNWQLHHLTVDDSIKEQFIKINPEVDANNVMILTGTVVDDPTGRWRPGHHFRSTFIVNLDRKNNTVETLNTIYHVDPDTENMDVMPDLGNEVLKIFY
ncbi:MAG: hypothetical protein KAJ62_11600 [Desulfobacteraceae bacterium]|nr:hypothetical protein [Desulfobacteraceae bacterium]